MDFRYVCLDYINGLCIDPEKMPESEPSPLGMYAKNKEKKKENKMYVYPYIVTKSV